MKSTRTRVLVAVVLLAAATVLVVAGAGLFGPISDGSSPPGTDGTDDRTDEPSTTDTVGYVEGYWHDDELPVDDRDDAALSEDELEAVVYRSMARVEEIRGLTFEEDVDVEVVSREEYRAESDDLFVDVTDDERLQQNVNYEALFVVDRATDAEDEFESLYGGAVDGYYDPGEEEVVLVSDSPDAPETDEIVLGHELLHALQDQQFDLSQYDRETIDQSAAKNGLIEGDAVWVETEYERLCRAEWSCVRSERSAAGSSDLNWGLYLIVYQPYADGPDYVEYLREQDDGWDAVNAAYDDPPASSADVIRPSEDREPVDVDVPDRSSDDWEQLEVDGETATETVGEVGMVAMFAADAFDSDRSAVIEREAFVTDGVGYEYDQPQTDGWAGDRLVTYVSADVDPTNESAGAIDRTGYVWHSEWETDEDAATFRDAYLELLAAHDAEAVDDRPNAFEIDDGYPGAYYVDRDDRSVTIVRAPSVDDLEGVDAVAASDEHASVGLESDDGTGGVEGGSTSEASAADAIGGGGSSADSVVVAGAVVAGTGVAIVVRRRAVSDVDSNRKTVDDATRER
ncbi:Hvo_1808 family surface protein [Natrarchaeobius oligotrophus]|uniref:PGF-CTERM sorting domain-containing protein n=1 Tax=Natrarchaeobius chitinivorans TaxID=1679083 RepID=A0A3N6M235_NATCH|nr:Hvo_1808 family surface protein [Natrarchaeobius chitinivorans]RQG97428.1 hypothetical protein EA472_19595 [Natrarchaeobius chitinivorans]